MRSKHGSFTQPTRRRAYFPLSLSICGGSWDDGTRRTRSAARFASSRDWKQQDPQLPQSIWYFTDALYLGFRIVRPLHEPSEEEKAAKWDKSEPPQIDKDKGK